MITLIFLLIPVSALAETCLIDCRASIGQLPIVSNEIVTVLGSSVGGFSVDFSESCNITDPSALVDSIEGSDGSYEYMVLHTSLEPSPKPYHGVCGDGLTTSFEYLNSSQSGEILNGEYTYKCMSSQFFPDDSYFPRPDRRTQSCMYGIQLVPGISNEFGAAFWSRKQKVIYGFETTFKFRILNRSIYCGSEQSPNKSKWCYKRGGRGFAFVIQNEGSPGFNGTGDAISYKISTLGRVNLGYTFPRNLAVEFDYFFETDSNDPNWNHIAVMAPVSKQPSEGDNSNSADHSVNTLAMVSGRDLPELNEGLHTVRINYDIHEIDKWQHMTSEWFNRPMSDTQKDMMSFWSHNRPGILTVHLDGKSILRTLVDISLVVQADPVTTFSDPEPDSPNSASPGSAWVGFVASTGADNFASPIIVDWRWSVDTKCPADDLADVNLMTCARGKVVGDPEGADVKFKLRNIGTVDVRVVSTLDDNQANVCKNGFLAWNQIHPYFLGCERSVALGANLTSILITDAVGVRSLRLTDQSLINRDYTGAVFLRREIPEYCVIEHESDPYRFYFAQCDCSFCARVFDNQQLFSVFYSQLCYDRYTYSCSCFEVSQMSTDTYAIDYANRANPWKFISEPGYSFQTKNMQFQRHTVCRGCKFDYHCSRFNKLGICDTPATVYHVGNPLRPVIGGSFQNWSRGAGAEDGAIKGNACNCGDRIVEPTYTNTRGTAQTFPVYLIAYLQGTVSECSNCLRLPGSNCASVCGSPQGLSYLHHPTGQSCATCMLASSSLFDVTPNRVTRLRNCAYQAIQAGQDPWTACVDTVNSWLFLNEAQGKAALSNYLNGVATHFLTECPSRDFETEGAVCAPNLYANSVIQMQALARGPAEASTDGIYFPVWWDGVACMNAACELQTKADCYVKRYKLIFEKDPVTNLTTCRDQLGSNLGCYITSANTSDARSVGFNATNATAVFNKTVQQYGYTDALQRVSWSQDPAITGMKRKSLEVWASVDPSDSITDVNLGRSVINASSSWGDDYQPSLAVDGLMSTFWQSTTSNTPSFVATWAIDFGNNVQNAQGYLINWAYYAVNFTVQVSMDGARWTVVDTIVNNNATSTVSSSFLAFTKLRIVMTVAGQTRPAGQDQGLYAYGISEISIVKDSIISRLKPIEVVQRRQFTANKAIDGDLNTWWSTPGGVDPGVISFTHTSALSSLALIRTVYRRGFVPSNVLIELTDAQGNWNAVSCSSVGCSSSPDSGFEYILSLSLADGSANVPSLGAQTSFRVTSTSAGPAYYGQRTIQMAEFEVYVAGNPATVFSPSVCTLGNRQSCPSMTVLDGGSTAYFTNWTSSSSLDPGDSLGVFEISFADSNSVAASITVSSPSSVTVLPAYLDVGSSNVFSVVVGDITDLTVRVVAPLGRQTIISAMRLKPIRKIALTSAQANAEWTDTLSFDYPVQGLVGNLIDGNYASEWRTKLGAPSMTGTSSVDLDYVLSFTLAKDLAVDMVYIDYSFGSDWFRVDGTSAVDANTYSCEWTPDLRPSNAMSTESSCAGGQIAVVDKSNFYRFANGLSVFGNTYWSDFSLTVMQVSALDRLANQPVIGIREIEIHSAFPRLLPTSILVDENPTSVSSLGFFDGNFSTDWSTAEPNAIGTSLWLDLQGADSQSIKRIELWWSRNSTVADSNTPSSVSIAVVYESANVAACNDIDAGSDISDAVLEHPSPGSPVTYTGVNGFIENRVRCVKILLFSPNPSISVSELVIVRNEPSLFAPIAGSSLTSPAQALDGNPSTSAVASSATALPDGSHYIMIDLVETPPGTPVWGVSASITLADPGFVFSSIQLYICSPTAATLAACTGRALSISVIPERVSQFLFGPGLSCSDCSRVALVFTPTSDSAAIAGNWFSISDLSLFASPNIARTGVTVQFSDDRTWTNVIEAADDGLNTTSWVSERDITSADVVLSLLPDVEGYGALDPSYAPTAATVPPFVVSELGISFFWPISSFSVLSSLDAITWTSRGQFSSPSSNITRHWMFEPFYANYLMLSLEGASINASIASSSSLWTSPLFGITEVVAKTLPTLQFNRSLTTASSVFDADYSINGPQPWICVPPIAEATLSVPPNTEIAGVAMHWLFPPNSYSVSYLNGQTLVMNQTSFALDPSYPDPSTYETTLSGTDNVDTIKLVLARFSSRNGVQMSALKNINVYKVDQPVSLVGAAIAAPAPDDSPAYLVDGDLGSYYTSPQNVNGPISVSIPIGSAAIMGKLSIVWRTVCASFSVVVTRITNSGDVANVTLFNTTSNSDTVTTLRFAFSVSNIYLNLRTNANGQSSQFSIYEIQLWSAQNVAATVVSATATSLQPSSAIDSSNSSMWMTSPSALTSIVNPVYMVLDLGAVYPVKQVSVLWGWAPFSNDWSASVKATRRDLQVSTDGVSFTSVVNSFAFNSTGRFDLCTSRLKFRYFRLVLTAPYLDAELDPTGITFGSSIRDIEVFYDDNINRDSGDKVVRLPSGGWWDFAPSLSADGLGSTFWLGRRGQATNTLTATFGKPLNLAGISLDFKYTAGTIGFYKSDDCSSFTLIKSLTNNVNSQVVLSGQDYQFRALCVQVRLSNALTQIANPDAPNGPSQSVFGIKTFAIMENMGGGGVFGIEAKINGVWGEYFDTITYAPFQPTQWHMLSNQQLRSGPVNGSTGFDDISNLVHVVATFSDTNVTLYRNGHLFGSSYAAPTIPWDMVEDVRLVFGVRSSAFVNNSDVTNLMGYNLPGTHYSYLDPFFSGQLKSLTLFSRELIPEEVYGLYLAGKTGTRERGCHCYDACPVGRNRLYPNVDIPCSGQGVCRRAYSSSTGLPTTGICECTPGFFGDNCDKHCSLNGGCCSVDDDCPTNLVCDSAKYTCVAPQSR